MYKSIRLKKKDNLKHVKSTQPRCQNLSIWTAITNNKLVIVMRSVHEGVEVEK
jgi:hypothetical protein